MNVLSNAVTNLPLSPLVFFGSTHEGVGCPS